MKKQTYDFLQTKNIKKNSKLLFVILIIIAVIQIFPLYWLITYSLKSNAEIFGDNVIGLPRDWRWVNYKIALGEGGILRYFINSVVYSGVTLLVAGLLSSMAAYGLMRMKWKFNKLIYNIFIIGIMIPTQATLLPLFQMIDKMGIKGGYLGLMIPYIVFALPMSIMILSSFFMGLPKELEEAAYIDGCGVMRCFFQIIFPMIKPALATASIFTFMATWNELMFANTLIDRDELKTLPVGIMSFVGQYVTDWGLIGAGMVIATLPIIIIYIFLSNQVQESLVMGAVKG